MLRSKKRRLQRCLYCFWHRACQHVMCPPRHTLCSSRPSASRKPLDPTCHCVWHQLARRCCPAMRTQTKQMLLGTSLLAHSLKQCPCPSISAKCDHSLCRTGACSMPSPNLQQCTWYVGQQARMPPGLTLAASLWRQLFPQNGTLSGINRPAMSRSVVDFPVPEPPIMPTASPRRTLMLVPRRICFLPKDLCTLCSSMRTSACKSAGEAAAVVGCLTSPGAIAVVCSSSADRQ